VVGPVTNWRDHALSMAGFQPSTSMGKCRSDVDRFDFPKNPEVRFFWIGILPFLTQTSHFKL
jgi:hypothetical protein